MRISDWSSDVCSSDLSPDIVHLLAAGAWIAAILALGTLLLRAHRSMVRDDAEHLHRALARFATVGTLAVALLVVTGLVNSWLLVGIGGLTSFGDRKSTRLNSSH